MFEELSEHGNNSTDYPETARNPRLPKSTPPQKCESSVQEGIILNVQPVVAMTMGH